MTQDKSPPANDDVIIEPPSDNLRKKAPLVARSLQAALKETEKVVAQIGAAYPERLASDSARLKELSRLFRQSLTKESMEEVRFLAHDMKGQGGQFGYPLVTAICDSLQKYLQPIEAPGSRTAEVIDVHVDALLLVVSKKLTGEGGVAGDTLRASLAKIVA
jgi:hypothetical protein